MMKPSMSEWSLLLKQEQVAEAQAEAQAQAQAAAAAELERFGRSALDRATLVAEILGQTAPAGLTGPCWVSPGEPPGYAGGHSTYTPAGSPAPSLSSSQGTAAAAPHSGCQFPLGRAPTSSSMMTGGMTSAFRSANRLGRGQSYVSSSGSATVEELNQLILSGGIQAGQLETWGGTGALAEQQRGTRVSSTDYARIASLGSSAAASSSLPQNLADIQGEVSANSLLLQLLRREAVMLQGSFPEPAAFHLPLPTAGAGVSERIFQSERELELHLLGSSPRGFRNLSGPSPVSTSFLETSLARNKRLGGEWLGPPAPFKRQTTLSSFSAPARSPLGIPTVGQSIGQACESPEGSSEQHGTETVHVSQPSLSADQGTSDRKLLRQAPNRDAARRMRKRHADRVAELQQQIDELSASHGKVLEKLHAAREKICLLEEANRKLREESEQAAVAASGGVLRPVESSMPRGYGLVLPAAAGTRREAEADFSRGHTREPTIVEQPCGSAHVGPTEQLEDGENHSEADKPRDNPQGEGAEVRQDLVREGGDLESLSEDAAAIGDCLLFEDEYSLNFLA